ncbi:PID-CTERM protein-sorting domain-containing protein [Hymenobacter ruricola]|uniref:VPDSG-CTERM protein sorting domain-containing protein n=1 Tax=Hymenobacter ruricola TaxID=2791023 RepID=A0ABS0I3C3_9BACT|nr:hypothetical protein [Hymenobacter ruricola]MBF9221455.1 hypothetical protein [Hymenobacter ruricola]
MFKPFLLCAALLVAAGTVAQAQGPSTGGPAPGTPPAATDVPLDGGASLLLASGLVFGLKKLRQRRQVAR